MVTAVALAFSLLQQPSITIPAGYYTLKELAAKVGTQGVSLIPDGRCSSDVYALRIKGRTWSDFQKALASDGRLTFSGQGNRWTVERSIKERIAADTSLKKYLEYARKAINAPFSQAVAKVRQLESLPQKERDARGGEFGSGKGKDQADQISNLLTYLEYENEVSFGALGIAALLTDPNIGTPLGQAKFGSGLEWMPIISATGTLRDLPIVGKDAKTMSAAALADLARNIHFAAKISFDPVTMNSYLRTLGYQDDFNGIVLRRSNRNVGLG